MTNHAQALYMIHALTPLHVGADQGIGAIDLPTLREAHTGWPIVPGSSVRGVLREQAALHFGAKDAAEVRAIFGPPTELAGGYRGGMVFSDAYPLLLPVRSLAGTFAWVTCAQVLGRLKRDAKKANLSFVPPPAAHGSQVRLPSTPKRDSTMSSDLVVDRSTQKQHVLLEDLCLDVTADSKLAIWGKIVAKWVWPTNRAPGFLLRRLALVSDDVFGYLCRHHLEICARVAIKDSTGIVDHGPWTEELIPGETVLCGIVQDRGTTVRTRKSESPNTARNIDEDGFEKDEKEPDVALAALRKLLSKPKVLRLGSHASLGLGRACVPLVTKLPGEETRQ